MKIVLLTQDEPFFLPSALKLFFQYLGDRHEVVAAVLLEASPFGNSQSLFQKAKKTFVVFGFQFFIYYSLKLLRRKLFSRHEMRNLFMSQNVRVIKLREHINHPKSVSAINECEPDVLISIAGNQIFRRPIIDLAPFGCLNLHTSALPKYRGLMPTFWVLKNGESTTAVSVFMVDEGIDSGPIVVQEKVEISNETQAQLIEKTKMIGMQCLVKAVDQLTDNTAIFFTNDDAKSSYYSFPTRSDVQAFYMRGKRFF